MHACLDTAPRLPLAVGRLGRPRGLKGELRVISYTTPPKNVFAYRPCWRCDPSAHACEKWQPIVWDGHTYQGHDGYGRIAGVRDRETASLLTHHTLFICRSQLPTLPPGDYYWAQLEGLTVVDITRGHLGQIDHLIATGSNDVLVVKDSHQTRLIPYLDQVVLYVDLDNRLLQVDWPEDI